MIRLCAWCGAYLGGSGDSADGVSHGMCASCYSKFNDLERDSAPAMCDVLDRWQFRQPGLDLPPSFHGERCPPRFCGVAAGLSPRLVARSAARLIVFAFVFGFVFAVVLAVVLARRESGSL